MSDVVTINQTLFKRIERLDKASTEIFKLAEKKAESERIYRVALAQEMLKLKSEGMPATLAYDVARGNVADQKFNRDKDESMYWAAQSSMEALKTECSVLQTINRWQSDSGG